MVSGYRYIYRNLGRCNLDIERELIHINSFVPNVPFLYPLKTSENFSLCFQGIGKGCIGNKRVK